MTLTNNQLDDLQTLNLNHTYANTLLTTVFYIEANRSFNAIYDILQTLELLSINVLSTALSVIMMLRQEIREVIALFAILGTNSQEFFALLIAGMERSMATKLVMTALTMERGVLSGA